MAYDDTSIALEDVPFGVWFSFPIKTDGALYTRVHTKLAGSEGLKIMLGNGKVTDFDKAFGFLPAALMYIPDYPMMFPKRTKGEVVWFSRMNKCLIWHGLVKV